MICPYLKISLQYHSSTSSVYQIWALMNSKSMYRDIPVLPINYKFSKRLLTPLYNLTRFLVFLKLARNWRIILGNLSRGRLFFSRFSSYSFQSAVFLFLLTLLCWLANFILKSIISNGVFQISMHNKLTSASFTWVFC